MNSSTLRIKHLCLVVACVAGLAASIVAAPLGTAFTYHGQLQQSGSPVNALCDFQFSLWDADTNGLLIGTTQTLNSVSVSNGLFAAELDFGTTAFNGDARWLEISVRTKEAPAFTTLAPRQQLTPAPYAIYTSVAGTASTATMASNAVPGSIGTAALAVGAVDSSRIADGAIAANDLSSTVLSSTFWRLGGNTGTTPGTHFLGTTDNQPLEMKVNNARALRLESGVDTWGTVGVNFIGGAASNQVTSGVAGATVFGGSTNGPNRVEANYATISGGRGHNIQAGADWATISGGRGNSVGSAVDAVIGGGAWNSIKLGAPHATIGGGNSNLASGIYSTVGGGYNNTASQAGSSVPGGERNSAGGDHSLAAGRRAKANHQGSFVWADSTDADFASAANNQFLIRASGGVGIGTNQTPEMLTVAGNVRATGFIGSGAGLTSIGGNAIAAGSISNAHLAAGSVTGATLADGAVSNLDLAPNAVTSAKIADGTIAASDVNAASFSNTFWKLDGNAGTISGVHILGTTDLQPLPIGVNNRTLLYLSTNGCVGIGTTNPSAPLEIAGSVLPSGNADLGAGDKRWSDLFLSGLLNFGVSSTNACVMAFSTNEHALVVSGLPLLDQGIDGGPGHGSSEFWQSFTAGLDGLLAKVALKKAYNDERSGLLDIRQGEGIAGPLLYSGTWQWSQQGWNECLIQGLVSLTAGSTYTIHWTANGPSPAWFHFDANDPYPRGRSSIGSASDFAFRTYVGKDSPVVFQTRVGVGTNDPASALQVQGTVIATAFQGDGAALTSLPAVNLVGTIPDARLSSNVALLNANPTFTGTVGFSPAAGQPFVVGNCNKVSNLNADLLDGMDSSAFWKLGGNTGTSPGSNFVGTVDLQPFELRVYNRRALRIEPNNTSPTIIGGAAANFHSGGVLGGTIAGGGNLLYPNSVGGSYSTVGGGRGNTASAPDATVAGGSENGSGGLDATVGGGRGNYSSGEHATVSGGFDNSSSGVAAAVGGGSYNDATGGASTVPGGESNTAAGGCSFAAGRRAKANHDGTFVWADSTGVDFATTANNQFLIRAGGGVGIGTNNPASALHVAGVVTAAGFSGSGAGLTGLSAGSLSGNVTNTLTFTPTSGAPFAVGNNNVVTNLNADSLDGLDASAFWKLGGNAGTTAGTHFLGTTDAQPLELRAGNLRGLWLQSAPDSWGTYGVNLVGGSVSNSVADGFGGVTIFGGSTNAPNHVEGNYATISGGRGNTIGLGAQWATISGGRGNLIDTRGEDAVIGGGSWNSVGTFAYRATIGGGQDNEIEQDALGATIAGGLANLVESGSESAAIGGGTLNWARGNHAFIGGGYANRALDDCAAIGGGFAGTASSPGSTVGGGSNNQASAACAFVGGGSGNAATAEFAAVAGGIANWADGLSAVIAGGYWNTASGESATIGGGDTNLADHLYATVGGGAQNSATNNYATVGGGFRNAAGGDKSAVCGGWNNLANGANSFVGGGQFNRATNAWSTVSGGQGCAAYGSYATVLGGHLNYAVGSYSLAGGNRAKANHQGSFVWGDSSNADVESSTNDEFTVRASGGAHFFSNTNLTSGVTLAAGGGSWSTVCDREAKRDFQATEPREILRRLAAMPIQTWSYKSQDTSIRHIGPVAQDFAAAFKVGEDNRHITTTDADGVALAAIQGLNELMKEKDGRIEALEQTVAELKAMVIGLLGKSNGGGR